MLLGGFGGRLLRCCSRPLRQSGFKRPGLYRPFARQFCYAVTTFGSDFEQCAHSALLRSFYAYMERGEANDPNVAVVLVDSRYLRDSNTAVEDIVPALREWSYGWTELSFIGAVIDASQFSLPSVSIMLITQDEGAFATVRKGDADEDVSVGRWHRPVSKEKAREQFERQADAYFERRPDKPVIGERQWFSMIGKVRTSTLREDPNHDIPDYGLQKLIAQSMTFDQLKETQESLALSSAEETMALTVHNIKESLSPAELEEIEELMAGHHPTSVDQKHSEFVLALGDTNFLQHSWLNETYPNACMLGLSIARTPFLTGTPVTYFMDDEVFGRGGIAIAFNRLFPFQIPTSSLFQVSHFGLRRLGENIPATVTEAKGNMILALNEDRMQSFMEIANKTAGLQKDMKFYVQVNGDAMVRITAGDPKTGRMSLDGGFNISQGDQIEQFYETEEVPGGDLVPDSGIVFTTTKEGRVQEHVIAGDRPGLFMGSSELGMMLGTSPGHKWICDAAGTVARMPLAGNSVYPIDEPRAAFQPVHRSIGRWIAERGKVLLPGLESREELPKPDERKQDGDKDQDKEKK